MSNGEQTIVINPSERAISDDINRAQRFRGLDLNELLRALADTYCGMDDLHASALDQQTTVQLSPVSSAVFNGLVVRPQIGSLNFFVDPGVCGLYDPDAAPSPDESQYKLIRDPGVQLAGALTLPPNTSGGTIISIVECARVAGGFSVLETDNRDIFNPVTGLFSATTVNKVVAGRLQYRVRSGGSGGGFPGTALGWMPLCVVSQPTGVTVLTATNCIFWDVRPFVGDRIFAPFNLGRFRPLRGKNTTQVDVLSVGGKALLQGAVEISATDSGVLSGGPPSLYRLGGAFDGTVDLDDTTNQSGTISTGNAYIYLMEPFGLPRWARYGLQSGVLIPKNTRGIPTVSMTAPIPQLLAPASPLAMPTSTGLGGTCTKAACIAMAVTLGALITTTATDGVRQSSSGLALPPYASKVLTNVGGGVFHGSYVPATDYPGIARSVRVRVGIVTNVAGSTISLFQAIVSVADAAFTAPVITITTEQIHLSNPTGGTLAMEYAFHIDIPINADQSSFGLIVDCSGATTVPTTVVVQVESWDVSP